jgi:V/A-type H+-transporting ATPase subunit E
MTKTLGDITSELTERILFPAKEESERILRDAKEEAKKIVTDAEREALHLRENAKKEADAVFRQMENDMKTAARNFLIMVQEKLEKTVVHPTVEAELKPLLSKADFLENILKALISEFNRHEGRENSIEVLLPEKMKDELEKWFIEKFRQEAIGPLVVHFTDKVSFGFKIGLEGTGSHFNFGEGLVEAFTEFCSPRFRKHFFPGKES